MPQLDDPRLQKVRELVARRQQTGMYYPDTVAPPDQFNTPLSPDAETQFQAWKQQYAPRDSGADYDLRGAYQSSLRPDAQTGHWLDTFKKPNHPTFSNESQYATGINAGIAGEWRGPEHDQYTPAGTGDEYRLEQVKKLRGQTPPQPDVTAPSQLTQSPYLQAAQLTEQANQPKPDPFQGMSPLKRMLGQGMLGAAEGSIHAHDPGGYQGYLDRQRAFEYQKQQDLLQRAKELRGEGMAQSRMYQEDVNAQLGREQHQREFDAQLEETKRLRATQEAAQERLANQPINVPQGTTVLDPQTRQPIYTNPKSQTAAEKGLQHVAGTINGQNAWAVFDPNPEPGKGRFTDPATGADISMTFKPMPPPVQFLQGPTGEISATGNPRTGQITPIQNPTGARRSPVPAGTLKDQRELENSQRKLTDLRTAFKPEFVGPVEGRVLRVKSKLPGTVMPQGWGTFIALQADLKNSVIKLITGAQMGKEEANRILDQVPTETDKPEIWLDKFNQTQKNVDYLNQLIGEQTGIGGAPPANPNTVSVEKWERDPATGLPRKVAK